MTDELQIKLETIGQREFDFMQRNLTSIITMTDDQLENYPDPSIEMFGSAAKTPEARRQEARRIQDKLDREGRENYCVRYARDHRANYAASVSK